MNESDSKNPDRKTWLIRKDLEFWRTMVSYVPRLEFQSKKDFGNLKGCIKDLDTELVELDFSGVISYLEYMESEAEKTSRIEKNEEEVKKIE